MKWFIKPQRHLLLGVLGLSLLGLIGCASTPSAISEQDSNQKENEVLAAQINKHQIGRAHV